jgi:hypothetical protein
MKKTSFLIKNLSLRKCNLKTKKFYLSTKCPREGELRREGTKRT